MNITRQTAQALIERIAGESKQYDHYCDGCNYLSPFNKPSPCRYHGHLPAEVTLADVLEKMDLDL